MGERILSNTPLPSWVTADSTGGTALGEDDALYSCGKAKGPVSVSFKPEVELTDLIENLPLLGGPAKANGQTIAADNEQPVVDTAGVPAGQKVVKSTARSRSIRVADSRGHGVEIRLDEERTLRICRSGMTVRDLVRFDRAEIVLPALFTKDEPVLLKYQLAPCTTAARP